MPVSLNVLIRYKTINSLLYGGIRKYDIYKLIDACSDAFYEARGRKGKCQKGLFVMILGLCVPTFWVLTQRSCRRMCYTFIPTNTTQYCQLG